MLGFSCCYHNVIIRYSQYKERVESKYKDKLVLLFCKGRCFVCKPIRHRGVSRLDHHSPIPCVWYDCSIEQKCEREEERRGYGKAVTKTDSLTVVLFQPKIPGNTGNIGRTCLAFGAKLHLIGPLGFSISEHAVRRAGLDYWKYVDLEYSSSWEEFEKGIITENSHIYFITTKGAVSLERVSFETSGSIFLVFGSETEGFQQLPCKALDKGVSVYIPMQNKHIIRSHNLSNAVAMALWEFHKLRWM